MQDNAHVEVVNLVSSHYLPDASENREDFN